MQSRTAVTGTPINSDRCAATGARRRPSTTAPSGRPRWDMSTTRAPCARRASIVGTAARIRVSSLIAPSCIGTLKSTLTSTRLSCASMSRMVCLSSAIIGNLCFGWRIQLRQMHEKPIIRSLLRGRMIGIKGHVATKHHPRRSCIPRDGVGLRRMPVSGQTRVRRSG